MTDEFEKKWQESQIKGWKDDKNEIVSFFERFGLRVSSLYEEVTNSRYDKMQIVCYLLSKIKKAIKICDYLDILEKEEHADIDAIKIFFLIAHAEITMNNFGLRDSKSILVSNFFKPVMVKHRLNYRMRISLENIKEVGGMSFSDILYKIRCEYAHEGNYTGKIFMTKKEEGVVNAFSFKSGGKDVFGECGLTYLELVNVYMEALVENIKEFLERNTYIV